MNLVLLMALIFLIALVVGGLWFFVNRRRRTAISQSRNKAGTDARESGAVNSAARQADARPGFWVDTFAPYPGARLLCSQAVDDFRSGVGFTWYAYATPDLPEKVRDFYLQEESREHVEMSEDSFQIRRGKRVLSIHRASAKDYPQCGVAPDPGDNTVIIVS